MAVCAPAVDGVGSLAATYADLVDATRTAQRLGRRGWIPDPDALALERLLLADRQLADAIVRRELGPLLADERFGEELIETLQAYFDAGENVTAAARRLNLATRTVAYRLEKIESLRGQASTARAAGACRPRSWCIGSARPADQPFMAMYRRRSSASRCSTA